MYTGSEETQCTKCDHREVCSLMGQMLNAQKAINEVTVSVGNKGIKYLRDFDWIKRVRLECTHFAPKRPTTRDISPQDQACASARCATKKKFMEDPT